MWDTWQAAAALVRGEVQGQPCGMQTRLHPCTELCSGFIHFRLCRSRDQPQPSSYLPEGSQPRCSSSLQPVLSRNLSSRNCCTRRLLWCLCCLQQALKFFTFSNNQACGPPVFINTSSKACICIQRAHMVLRSCVLITQASQSCCVDAHISPIVSPYWQHFRCTAQRLLPQSLQRGKRIIL